MKNAFTLLAAIAAFCLVSQANANLIHSYTVPWFDGPELGVGDGVEPDPGKEDFGGATWRHHRNSPWGNYSAMRTQQWSTVRQRWESTSGAGSSEWFTDGPLDNDTQPTLVSAGDQADATMMFAPAPPVGGGLYSFDGLFDIITSGTTGGTRGQIVHYDVAGDPTVLWSFSSGGDLGNQSFDLGAEPGLQNIAVLPGEHIGFGFRKVGPLGTAEAPLYGPDPLTITGDVIPEPASMVLIGLGMAVVGGLRRRSS